MGCGTSNEVNRKELDLGKESRKSALGKDTCRARWHLKDGRETDCHCEEEQRDLLLRKHLEHTHSAK